MFLQISHHFSRYGEYANAFKSSTDMLSQCEKENKNFQIFLEKKSEETGYPLSVLLVLPINQLNTYKQILEV